MAEERAPILQFSRDEGEFCMWFLPAKAYTFQFGYVNAMEVTVDYFISTCSSIVGGNPVCRTWLQQLQLIETDEPPKWVDIMMNCPQAAALYYRCRKCGLDLEKKIQTKLWDKRVNLSIFGMCQCTICARYCYRYRSVTVTGTGL
jgi:hypothetical protein